MRATLTWPLGVLLRMSLLLEVLTGGSLSNDEIELLKKLLKLLSFMSFSINFFRQAFLWHIHGHQAPDRVRVTIVFDVLSVNRSLYVGVS